VGQAVSPVLPESWDFCHELVEPTADIRLRVVLSAGRFLPDFGSQTACPKLVTVERHSGEKAIGPGDPADYFKTQPNPVVEPRRPGDRNLDPRSLWEGFSRFDQHPNARQIHRSANSSRRIPPADDLESRLRPERVPLTCT